MLMYGHTLCIIWGSYCTQMITTAASGVVNTAAGLSELVLGISANSISTIVLTIIVILTGLATSGIAVKELIRKYKK